MSIEAHAGSKLSIGLDLTIQTSFTQAQGVPFNWKLPAAADGFWFLLVMFVAVFFWRENGGTMSFIALLSVLHDGLGWEKVKHAPRDESNSGKKMARWGMLPNHSIVRSLSQITSKDLAFPFLPTKHFTECEKGCWKGHSSPESCPTSSLKGNEK